jgi:hypothetical protein
VLGAPWAALQRLAGAAGLGAQDGQTAWRHDADRSISTLSGYVAVTRGGDPMLWTILALACIVFAFVGELVDERLLFGTLEWFVAAIAFNTLGSLPFVKRR